MKKLLLLIFLYLLVEGDNVIGDGLYVYHRGKYAVDELKTKVDEYYPKVQAVDSTFIRAIGEERLTATDCVVDTLPPKREAVRRNRKVIFR